jgi:hypothetical protein
VALSNSEVLENLKKQLVEINTQYEQLATTRMKMIGAIDVLEQIAASVEEPETEEKE